MRLEIIDGIISPGMRRSAGIIQVRDNGKSDIPKRAFAIRVKQIGLEFIDDVFDAVKPVRLVFRIFSQPVIVFAYHQQFAVVIAV